MTEDEEAEFVVSTVTRLLNDDRNFERKLGVIACIAFTFIDKALEDQNDQIEHAIDAVAESMRLALKTRRLFTTKTYGAKAN
jgi:hypothetical protein